MEEAAEETPAQTSRSLLTQTALSSLVLTAKETGLQSEPFQLAMVPEAPTAHSFDPLAPHRPKRNVLVGEATGAQSVPFQC